jgi:hypothetical protein
MWQVDVDNTMVKNNWNGQDQTNSTTGIFHAYSPVEPITKKDALLTLPHTCK